MRVHVLVEGPADEAFLAGWASRLVPGHRIKVIPHEGVGRLGAVSTPARRGLLDQLPARLRAYGKSLKPDSDRVLILLDADGKDCAALKAKVQRLYESIDPRPVAKIRVAVQESEAFFLGDPQAIRRVWPNADTSYLTRTVPDTEWTWELFQNVIGEVSEAKVRWARSIAPHLTTAYRGSTANRSPSFRALCEALVELCGDGVDESRPRSTRTTAGGSSIRPRATRSTKKPTVKRPRR